MSTFVEDILVRQGTAAALAGYTLREGELGYTTDTKKLYVGTNAGNQEVGSGTFSALTKSDALQAAEFAADAGANDTYVITLAPAITGYVTGVRYLFKANTPNTGAATLNINGLGAKTIVKVAGGITTALVDNDIRAGQWVLVVYDGTNMQMISMLGNAGGAGTGGTKTLRQWGPFDGQPPSSNFATLNTRNFRALLEFDASTAESMVFSGIIPEAADFTTGIKVRLVWMGASATSGNVIWTASFERGNTDMDSDSFATGIDSSADAANGTSGIVTISSINFTGSDIDGLVAGDPVFLKITRKAADAGDTMTGDAQLIAVEIQQR